MKQYIQKANVLIEALPYIQKFRKKIFVVKIGGSVLGQDNFSHTVLQDLVFMACIGISPVLIHGGGHAISSKLKKTGHKPKFINGLRVTNEEVLKIVIDVLENTVNKEIIKTIKSFGGYAEGLSGKNGVLKAAKHLVSVKDKSTGKIKQKDIGYVGDIQEVFPKAIHEIITKEKIPVITPLGFNETKDTFNVNADVAAGRIAASLGAEKLVYLTNVEGIMRNIDETSSLISTIKSHQIEEFIDKGVISGGMIPKVNSGLRAIKNGVKKTHIVDGRIPHSLLLEIFTDKGIGTEIIK